MKINQISVETLNSIEAEAKAHLRAFPDTTADEWVQYTEGVLDAVCAFSSGLWISTNDLLVDRLSTIFDNFKKRS